MILTDREIKLALLKKQIELFPAPDDESFTSTAVDLTLHQQARIFRKDTAGGVNLDPGSGDYNFHAIVDALTETVDLNPRYPLPPNNLLLAWTNEEVTLPTSSRLAARVEGKSSLARIGMGVHITAPLIHAGFSGRIQLEIINHGSSDIVLRPGMRICQLVFEMTFGTPEKGYSGLFTGQGAN